MNDTATQNTLQVRKLFWGWEDDKEEAWLREQANQGHHLKRVDFGLYTFEIGEPRDMVYRLDFPSTSDPKQIEEYLQIFQDAGWEPAGEQFGWRYFRKPYQPGQQDEIYSDPESKIAKYKRLLYLMLGIMPVAFMSLVNSRLFLRPPVGGAAGWLVIGLLVLILLIEIYISARLWMRIQQLKRL